MTIVLAWAARPFEQKTFVWVITQGGDYLAVAAVTTSVMKKARNGARKQPADERAGAHGSSKRGRRPDTS